MAVKVIICLSAVLLCTICESSNLEGPKHGKVVVCYLTPSFELSDYQNDEKRNLCTHLVIETAHVNTMNYTIEFDHTNSSQLTDFISYTKKSQRRIQITMAVRIGYQTNVFTVPSDLETRVRLIENAIVYVRYYDLDGLDLYVSELPKTREDADSLKFFAQELKESMFPRHIVTATFLGRNRMVGFTDVLVSLGYYLDLIHIPASDIVTTPRRLERTIAPLKGRNGSDDSSVEFVIKHLLAHGVKPVKLVLVLDFRPFFYLLPDSEIEDIHLDDLVVITYRDVQQRFFLADDSPWQYYWNEEVSARYFRYSNVIAFSESPRSVAAKVKLGIDYGLKGFALWVDYVRYSCAPPNDTYVEFIGRYNKLKEDPHLLEKLTDLNLPNVDAAGNLDGKSYGVLNNTLYFKAPKLQDDATSIVFYRVINEAIILSLEEKKILDALKTNNKKMNRPYCIFWPRCTEPIPLPTRSNKTSRAGQSKTLH